MGGGDGIHRRSLQVLRDYRRVRIIMMEPARPVRSCGVCGGTGPHRSLMAREMMFGLRDEFEYFECASCGCVQIVDPPADMAKYYPSGYSVGPRPIPEDGPIRRFLMRQRTDYVVRGKGWLGRAMAKRYGQPRPLMFGSPDHYAWLRNCGVGFGDRILDVGCGDGHLLVRLWRDGYRQLAGVDPLIPETLTHGGRFTIWKKTLFEVGETFDFIMMHHSFEHMPEPGRVLKHLAGLLAPGRFLLVRIPVASSYAYRHYGADWVQLDPPRHFFLHTEKSMQLLADAAGLAVANVIYDSSAFQFLGSEQYLKDIPLSDSHSFLTDPNASIFSKGEIAGYEARADELNRRNEGDSACFYLRKAM